MAWSRCPACRTGSSRRVGVVPCGTARGVPRGASGDHGHRHRVGKSARVAGVTISSCGPLPRAAPRRATACDTEPRPHAANAHDYRLGRPAQVSVPQPFGTARCSARARAGYHAEGDYSILKRASPPRSCRPAPSRRDRLRRGPAQTRLDTHWHPAPGSMWGRHGESLAALHHAGLASAQVRDHVSTCPVAPSHRGAGSHAERYRPCLAPRRIEQDDDAKRTSAGRSGHRSRRGADRR